RARHRGRSAGHRARHIRSLALPAGQHDRDVRGRALDLAAAGIALRGRLTLDAAIVARGCGFAGDLAECAAIGVLHRATGVILEARCDAPMTGLMFAVCMKWVHSYFLTFPVSETCRAGAPMKLSSAFSPRDSTFASS